MYRTHLLQLPGVFLVILFALIGAPLHAEPVVTIQRAGEADNRVDIVFVGDGYTSADLAQFAQHVEAFVQGMFDQEPFKSYRPYFNIHRVEVVSLEAGADHPSRNIFKNTALDATFDCAGIQRMVCVNHTSVEDVLARSVDYTLRDIVIVLVNDPEYGGSGGTFAVSSTHSDAVELILHEMGHSFGLLADEYEYGPPECRALTEPVEPNVTIASSRTDAKWRAWIELSTPVPTVDFVLGVPGLYEGAKYCVTAMYRPTADSKMRSLHRSFEQINIQQLVTRIYNIVTPIDLFTPAAERIVAGQSERISFNIVKLRPATHALRVRWELDGREFATSDEIALDTSTLAAGDHQVTVTVDDPTESVRDDPNHALSDVRSWVLHVAPPTPPVVTVTAPNGGEVLAGDTVFQIAWEARDDDGLARFDVELSLDGLNFAVLPECGSLPGSNRSCTAKVPNRSTSSGRVRVTAYDARGSQASDTSDGAFSIDVRAGDSLKPWISADVGLVQDTGTAQSLSGAFQLSAGGVDVWGTADAFQFVHQRWTGDGDMVIRVDQLQQPADAAFAMAGVMFRESLAAGARHASLVITTTGKAKIRRRLVADGETFGDGPTVNTTTVPRWLRLSRRGNVFTASLSLDGTTWTAVAAPQTVVLPSTLNVGFLALRKGGTGLATARVSGISLLPSAWSSTGIGTTGTRRSATYAAGEYTLASDGVDVWGTADAFHFVHRRWTGDGDMVLRVDQLQQPADAAFAMAGVMFRESLAAGARHASLVITTTGKAKFRRRLIANGETLGDGPSVNTTTVPRWLRLSRRGNVFTASLSLDGITWTSVAAPQTVVLPSTLNVGFLALRKGGTGLATARVSGISLLPAGWSSTGIGATGSRRSATYAAGEYTLASDGVDVWGTADAFHFVHRRWTGDGDMVLRVDQLQQPADAAFAMAGVMFRESLAAGARHASLVITTTGKAKFRRRLIANGETLGDGPSVNTTTVPRWLRLSRRGNVFTASLSLDGTTWTAVSTPQTIALPTTLNVGFLALRKGGTGLATARVSGVRLLVPAPPPEFTGADAVLDPADDEPPRREDR